MEKRNNRYGLELKECLLKDGSGGTKQISLDIENHDDLFKIFEIVQAKKIFADEQTAQEFTLGLKLFTEVMLKNSQHPLFEDFRPAVADFMKKLKAF